MKERTKALFGQLFEEIPALGVCRRDVEGAFLLLRQCFLDGGKVLVCGNGGSASDAEHIVGELMKGFLLKRGIGAEDRDKLTAVWEKDAAYLADHLQGALSAISLVGQSAFSTAFTNDVAADMVFAQQVYGYARQGDVLIGLSTSGNSGNVVNAMKVAKSFGLKLIGMTGKAGGCVESLSDVCIKVPVAVTYRVQEYHLPVYHTLCAMLEADFFDD